jgi:hypothetical protein
MKKLIFLLLPLLSTCICAAQEFDFRKTNWGCTKSQVKSTESLETFLDKDEILGYSTSVANLECTLGFYFKNNSLYKGAYIFSEEHSNKNDYLMDYFSLKQLLKEKYGEPQIDEIIWKNKLYQDDKENYGLAISIGHLELYCNWETEDTLIQLSINGDNYEISLQTIYKSKKLSDEVEKMKQKNVLDDL